MSNLEKHLKRHFDRDFESIEIENPHIVSYSEEHGDELDEVLTD